ncbi:MULTISPECIES: cell wall-binding repeat-containing protein [unclassified Clostridium]|uniref:cell wall-binding repeat-containing protein n=1 Tax=unclassified Clostridium TaxID=2614128 RepID=UPI0025B83CB6|nr:MULTISPECIES: cell wall-binding repeat-containing protein [unclassified Clostridium]
MKKSSRVISTLLLGATLTTLSANVFAVESKETIEKKLLAGNNRYETAVKVSEKWEKADNVVLVNALAMADALAATPLAKLKDAPILLTDAGELTKATKERIEKLGAKNVFVVGGEGVVSKAVVAELEKAGLKVERISGVDRFETSAKVAKELDAKKVAVVNGLNGRLADALSVAAPAAENNMAILLTNGKDLGAVKDAAKDKEAVVVGGSAVVADSIKSDLKAERLGGANRNETNAEVMKKFYGDKQVKSVYVAKDGAAQENQLVDALAAGPVAGKEGAPIVLAGSKLADGQKKFLEGQGEVATVYEVGGGINTSTVKDLMTALGVKDVVDKAEVSSVKATNLREVVVTFGMKVDRDSAEDKTNYSLNKEATIKSVELSEDGRTAVITVDGSLKNQDKYKLTVDSIIAGDKEITAKDYEFTPIDNTLPEVKEVKSLGTKAIKVVFNEPINKVNSNNFKLDGKSFYGDVKNEGREVILTPYEKNSLKPGDYKLSVEGVEDYATLKSLASEHKFTVVEDKTPPKVEKVVATLEKVKITFSEDVDPDTVKASNLYYKKSDDKKVKADDYKKINGTTYEFYFEGDNRLPGYEMTMYIEDVKDYSDNKITETSFKVKPEVDQERPKVKSVSVNTAKNKVTVKFSKIIHKDSLDAKYFTIKDKDSKLVGIDKVSYGAEKNIVELDLYKALPAGKNTIKISGVKDSTYLQNVMLDYEGTIDAADTTSPKKPSYSVSEKERTVVLTFDKKMDASTLANPSNYVLTIVDDKDDLTTKGHKRALPSDTEITIIQGGKGVKLVFPEYLNKDTKLIFGGQGKGNTRVLTYMGLKDEAGNIVDQYSGDVALVEEIGAIAYNYDKDKDILDPAVAKDRKTIKVKFNQAIAKASASNFKVELGGTKVTIDEVETNNSDVVVIKLKDKLATTATDNLKVFIDSVDGMETAAGSAVGKMKVNATGEIVEIGTAGIAIADELSPEVKLEKDERYEVNGNKITIPFTEELKHDVDNASRLEQYKADLLITRINGNSEVKSDKYNLTFGTKEVNGKTETDYSKLIVEIIAQKDLADSAYEITVRNHKDGETRYIEDAAGNAALAKDATYTNGKVTGINKTENDKDAALKDAKDAADIELAKIDALIGKADATADAAEITAVNNAKAEVEKAKAGTDVKAITDATAKLETALKSLSDKVGAKEEADKIAAAKKDLADKIDEAKAAKKDVATSTDGKDVETDVEWVTADVAKTFDEAINAAEDKKTATVEKDLTDATGALDAAIKTYNKAKAPGTKA